MFLHHVAECLALSVLYVFVTAPNMQVSIREGFCEKPDADLVGRPSRTQAGYRRSDRQYVEVRYLNN